MSATADVSVSNTSSKINIELQSYNTMALERGKKLTQKSKDIEKNNSIQCYINEDNTISFISDKKSSLDQSVGNYKACLTSNDEVVKEDQILQLISQNQFSSCGISDKEYRAISSINNTERVPENICTNSQESNGTINKQCCIICELDFPSKRAFSKHMTIHENDREYKCGWCKMSYNHEINLLVHIPTIHPKQCFLDDHCNFNEKYRCLVCSRKFSREKSLQSHCLIHQVDEQLLCEHCSDQFNSRVLLEKHAKIHNLNNDQSLNGQEIYCNVCQQQCKSVRHMSRHYNQFHPTIETKIESVTKEKNSDDEQNVDPSKKPKIIKSESLKFKLYEKVKKSQKCYDSRTQSQTKVIKSISNIQSVDNVSPSTSPITIKLFGSLKLEDTEKNECPICKKIFIHKQSVKVHMMVHDSIKAFQCKYCSKSFTYEHNMNTHIRCVHRSNKRAHDQYISSNGQTSLNAQGGNKAVIEKFNVDNIKQNNVDCDITPNYSMDSCDDIDTLNLAESMHGLDNQKFILKVSKPLQKQISKESFQNSLVALSNLSTKGSENVSILTSPHFINIVSKRFQNLSEQPENVSLVYDDEMDSKVQTEKVNMSLTSDLKELQLSLDKNLCLKRSRLSFTAANSPISIHLRPLKCYICSKSFQLKSVLKNHFKSHWKARRLSCEICAKKFDLKSILKIHSRLHTLKNMRYSCNFCIKKFSTLFHYTNHNRVEHKQSSMLGVFGKSDKVKENEKTVSDVKVVSAEEEQPPIGEEIQKLYEPQEETLEYWEESDNSTKIACDYCDKLFRNLKSMQQHLRTQHLNRCIFKCPDCPSTFAFKGSLRRHELVHSQAKPFKCPLCFRPFKTRAYVERHLILKNGCKSGNYNRAPDTVPTAVTEINKIGPNFESEILTNAPSLSYCNYQSVDLDLNNVQSHNLVVKNDATGNKFVVLALNDKGASNEQQSKSTSDASGRDLRSLSKEDHVEDCRRQDEKAVGRSMQSFGGNVSAKLVESIMSRILVYAKQQQHQQNEVVEPSRGPIVNKFPLMEATLFSDDDSKLTPSTTDGHCLENQNELSQEANNINSDTIKKRFRGCVNCSDLFEDSESLKYHVKRQHKAVKEFVCNFCNKAFSVQLSLWAHSKIHRKSYAGLRNNDCIACDQKFVSVRSLSRHVRMQHNEKLNLYRCTHCNESYKTTRELDSHIKQINYDCDAIIINPNLFKDPLKKRVDQKEKKDPNYRRSSLIELRDSEIDHIASLDVTNTSTLSMQELIKAARYKKGLKNFPQKNKLNHNPRLESSVNYPYDCSLCDKAFAIPSHLQQHLSVHTKIAAYQCTRCTKKFTHRSSLKTHENAMHSALMKLFRCHLCMKLLRSQVSLGNHMKIHLKSRTFQCTQCLTLFPTHLEQLRHYKLKQCSKTCLEDVDGSGVEGGDDSPVIRVKCVVCCSVFESFGDYENHGCKTIDRQLYQCAECDDRFTSSTELSSHLCDVHSQSETFSCSQCSLLFMQQSTLLKHIELVHNI